MKRGIAWITIGIIFTAVWVTAGTLGDLPPYTPDANAERESIPNVYLWDLGDLFADEVQWETAYNHAVVELAELGVLHDSLDVGDALPEYLQRFFDLELLANRLTLFANLSAITDTTDQDAIARHQRALSLTNAIMDESAVLRNAVLSLSDADLESAYSTETGLDAFRPAIDGLRRRADRVLDAEAERVLGLAGDNLWAAIDLNELPSPVERAFQALISEMPLPSIADSDGAEVPLTFANYGRYRASDDRQVREQAVESMFATIRRYENTFAATLGGQAQLDVAFARARGYDTALEAYLDKDDIDTAVYRTLIETVRAHAPALQRYVALRKEVMGLDEVRIYDLYVPLVESAAREMTYAEGAEVILESLKPLGNEYLTEVGWLVNPANGAIDVYPSKRKESGAFSSSVYGVHPFIKMNFQDGFDDVSTLAHELGHAMHTQLTNANQPYLQSRYSMLLAEVASTCNEMLLSQYMLAHAASSAERAWLLTELAEGIRQTIYRQTLFAEFELRLHELVEAGEPVTASRLNEIYTGLIADYYGPQFTLGPNDGVEWAYIPHFYYKYYVYSYATGMASAIAIADKIGAGEPGAADAYLAMLKGGNTAPPVEMLAAAGADLTKPDAIAAALDRFDAIVTELEELLMTP